MSERKLCGFDLNGWRDFTAKNWRSVPGEEEEIGPVDIVPSGPLSSVVRVGENDAARWIGGPQADVAPHGRGGGWGDIGHPDRRVSVRALLEREDADVGKLSAALLGSARGSAHTVVAIDEGPDGSETNQEHLLDALARGTFRNGALVWRPVLAALFAIRQDLVAEGQIVGVVCQDRQGFSVQKLRIRSARHVLAPERREAATLFPCDAGYANLIHNARKAAVGAEGYSFRTAHRAMAPSVGMAGLGMTCTPEILRLQNGDWEVQDLSAHDASASISTPLLDLSGCDAVLFETLSEGRLKNHLICAIQKSTPIEIVSLPATAVALGALEAARRAGDGAPIFFDFLPRLSTIVFGLTGATNFDLVRQDETLEAGRTYRSPEPASLAIPAGQESVSVYLRKEATPWPRKAQVPIGSPLRQQAAVSLWVEQKPAAGRARILMEARDLGRTFVVEWDDAQSDERSWDDIIDSLQVPVSIPQRLVLPCGMEPWRGRGMLSLLDTVIDHGRRDWKALAQKIAQRPYENYCISSDGEVPTEIEVGTLERLDILTNEALGVTAGRLRGENGPDTDDNEPLKFLTWQFRRCPRIVATWLMDCIETKGRGHPFVRYSMGWKLVYQGLGRIAGGPEDEARAMKLLLASNIETWTWDRQTAAMAFLLSRSDTAPLHLNRNDVERLASRTIEDFGANIGMSYTTFNYAPFLLAGLIRWRLANPSARVLGVDPLAKDLLGAIERTELDLRNRRKTDRKFRKRRARYLPILKDLKAELEGMGSNPDLLLDIYGASGGSNRQETEK